MFTVRSRRQPEKRYKVWFANGRWRCGCKGFSYRQSCWHVALLKGLDLRPAEPEPDPFARFERSGPWHVEA